MQLYACSVLQFRIVTTCKSLDLLFQLLDFDIQRLIDHGTEGAVFLATSKQARHPDKSKQYALKVMFNIFQLTSVTQVKLLKDEL